MRTGRAEQRDGDGRAGDACGDDDGGSPGAFTLTTDTPTLSVTSGASSSTEVTINRTGAFTAPVDVSVEGLPAGLTATVSPTTNRRHRAR